MSVGAERDLHAFAVLVGPDLSEPHQIEHHVRLNLGYNSRILILLSSRHHDVRQDDSIDHSDYCVDITGDIDISG